jgi:hypothetical protein
MMGRLRSLISHQSKTFALLLGASVASTNRIGQLSPAREIHRYPRGLRPHKSGDRNMAKKMIRPLRSEADYDDAALNEIEQSLC